MRVKTSTAASVLCLALLPLFTRTAFAESRWINTSGGTLDWNVSGNWSGTFPPTSADDVRITNDLLSAQTITNAGGAGVVANTSTINFLAVSNGLGSTPVTVIQNPNVFWVSRFGAQLGRNATLLLTTNAQFGVDQNMTFDLRAGGQPGTLTISNGAILFLVRGAGSTTNPVANAGTIQLTAAAGRNSQINYGQTLAFTNDTLGTIVKRDAGTGSFVGNFGSQNRPFINNGTILVNAGTLRLDPRDAFSRGGFQNTVTGFVQVDTGAVFELRRTINAWNNGPSPTNFGTVFMNGGTMLTFDADTPATNTARVIVNAAGGAFRGNGLLNFTLRNQGVIEARDGTLSVVASAGNVGTWVSTNYGGASSVLNFTTGNFDLGGGALLNSNGALRVINGANMTLSTAYRQNWGTIDIAGPANIFIANAASAGALTNEFVIKKTAGGNATLTTGFGSGQNNFGFINNGTLDIGNGDRFTINTANTFFNPFLNGASGTMAISGSSTVRLARTSAAWNGGDLPLNSGMITLVNGALETADDTGLNSARFLRNAGTINGNGTINASITNLSGGVIAPGLSLGTLNVGGSVVFGSNSAFVVELGLLAGQNDLLAIAGALTLDASSVLNISGGAVGNVYTVATFSAVSGVFGSVTPNYNVTYNANSLSVELIPEPSALALAAMGLATLLALRRRHGNNRTR